MSGHVSNARRSLRPFGDALLLLAVIVLSWQALYAAVGEVALTSPLATLENAGALLSSSIFWRHVSATAHAAIQLTAAQLQPASIASERSTTAISASEYLDRMAGNGLVPTLCLNLSEEARSCCSRIIDAVESSRELLIAAEGQAIYGDWITSSRFYDEAVRIRTAARATTPR